eukprot:TRINITY_DN6247_c0_g1_i1.p1 TRINITY_DN6247_c0_g1~~TRINITY_DN6247_c0_g1_i1.p1  ORF type:complete len:362 (-),score=51.44 TRINITY_DN6247_c0_g1_i1:160-1245(-)
MADLGEAVEDFDRNEQYLQGSQGSFPSSPQNDFMQESYGSNQTDLPMMPFNPPEEVRRWLKPGDWEALSKAWSEAEAQAISWPDNDLEGLEDEYWQEQQPYAYNQPPPSFMQSGSSMRSRKGRPEWDQTFNLLGSDSRKPANLRRYFDGVPAEIKAPHETLRPGLRVKKWERGDGNPGAGWDKAHHLLASVDNDGSHPLMRHYFDRRGCESSYRQRPYIDGPWTKSIKPRTPGRDKIDKSTSLPNLSTIDTSIPWGKRCFYYGADPKARVGPNGEKIPWCGDFAMSESADNYILNPLNRHYFDREGLESSFRNRGRDYGRKKVTPFGIELPSERQSQQSPSSGKTPKSTKSSKGKSMMSRG